MLMGMREKRAKKRESRRRENRTNDLRVTIADERIETIDHVAVLDDARGHMEQLDATEHGRLAHVGVDVAQAVLERLRNVLDNVGQPTFTTKLGQQQ